MPILNPYNDCYEGVWPYGSGCNRIYGCFFSLLGRYGLIRVNTVSLTEIFGKNGRVLRNDFQFLEASVYIIRY